LHSKKINELFKVNQNEYKKHGSLTLGCTTIFKGQTMRCPQCLHQLKLLWVAYREKPG